MAARAVLRMPFFNIMRQKSEEFRRSQAEKVRNLWKDSAYRLHMSEAHKGKKQTINQILKRIVHYQNEKHWMWKGDGVPYRTLHQWVESHLGKPGKCSACGISAKGHQIHWANKSREYKRDLSDWIRLCAKCHGAYDRNQLALSLAS